MTVEANLVGLACNLNCTYCYETPMRPFERVGKLKVLAILRELKKQGTDFTLFGGEPLLLNLKQLEFFFRWGFKHYGKNGIQTNGTLIRDAHLDLFRKYNVHVGFSLDGPGDLNDAREANTGLFGDTRLRTEAADQNLRRCLQGGIGSSLIFTLHRLNGVGEGLERLVSWLTELSSIGLRSARIHLLELDNPQKTRKLVLTPKENADAVLRIGEVKGIEFDILTEMRSNLQGNGKNSSCVWNGCDVLNTTAVHGVDRDGTLSNCGRANRGHLNYRKATSTGTERLRALYHTPQVFGGCAGCRFFLACKGYCPGTGEGGDWRRKTEHCLALYRIFTKIEAELVQEGVVPVSLREDRGELERALVGSGEGIQGGHGDQHADHHANVPHSNVWFVPVGKPGQ